MAYIGVKRPESLPRWIDRPPANPRRPERVKKQYKPLRIERRGGGNFYYKPDLDAYLEFRDRLAMREVVLAAHKPVRVCAECGQPWPCEDYRKAVR